MLLLANKLIEKIPDPRNAKELFQSFIRKKNTKSLKQSKLIPYPNSFENPNIVDLKSVIQNIQKLRINFPRLQGRLKK